MNDGMGNLKNKYLSKTKTWLEYSILIKFFKIKKFRYHVMCQFFYNSFAQSDCAFQDVLNFYRISIYI